MMKNSRRIYDWSGFNQENKVLQGSIQSASLRSAKIDLLAKGIKIQTIQRRHKPIFSLTPAVKQEDILFISRQLAVMTTVGIPLSNALGSIAKGSGKKSVVYLLTSIRSEIEAGMNLSAALELHSSHFDRLYIGMIGIGEESGTLDTVMDRIATHMEKSRHLKDKIKSALFYPALVMGVAVLIITLLLIIVIPEFEKLFSGFGERLPAMTRYVILSSQMMREHGFLLIVSLLPVSFFIAFFYHRSDSFQKRMDLFLLHVPVCGKLHQKSVIARIASTLSIMSGAGVPLTYALETVSQATGSRIYTDALLEIKREISNGKTLASSMESSGLFPAMILQMVSTGEESGELEVMLQKIAEFHEQEIDVSIHSMGQLIEPILIIVLGVIVGAIVIAMYLPVFQSGSVFH